MWRRRNVHLRWKRLGALTTGIKLDNGNWLHLVNNIQIGSYELVEITRRDDSKPGHTVHFHGYYRTPDEAKSHVKMLLATDL